jgi:hypothetical protein
MTSKIDIDGIVINNPLHLGVLANAKSRAINGVRLYNHTGDFFIKIIASDLYGNIVWRMDERGLSEKKQDIPVVVYMNDGVYKFNTIRAITASNENGYTTLKMKCRRLQKS